VSQVTDVRNIYDTTCQTIDESSIAKQDTNAVNAQKPLLSYWATVLGHTVQANSARSSFVGRRNEYRTIGMVTSTVKRP